MRKELIVITVGLIVSLFIIVAALVKSRDTEDGTAYLTVPTSEVVVEAS